MLFAIANLLIGFGSSVTFAPLIADISHWFTRRRGIAVAICASGNYLGGAIWPPVVQRLIETSGWRANQVIVGIVCIVVMLPLSLVLRRRLAVRQEAAAEAAAEDARASLGLHPAVLFALLASPASGVLCRHVDAAGAHRRLLRRPWLRRGARGGDALADAGLRHHQPHRLGVHRRPHRRAARRC